MSKKAIAIAGVIAVLLAGGVVAALLMNNSKTTTEPEVETQAEVVEETPAVEEETPAAEEVVAEAAEEVAEEEEEVEEAAEEIDALARLEITDSWEFALSDYNADYQVGDKVTIEITMESEGSFSGGVGACVGSNYDWEQIEYEFEGGSNVITWTLTPSVDSVMVQLWWADTGYADITDISVEVVVVEAACIGQVATLMSGDLFEFNFSDYYEDFVTGKTYLVTVVLESDGDFQGSIGACIGSDYEWYQQNYSYSEAGTYTVEFLVKPSADYSNICIWWCGGTSVAVQSITLERQKQELALTGDYIYTFTEDNMDTSWWFSPADYNNLFRVGDGITITLTLESDGNFSGCLGTCVGSSYEWVQTSYSSETGISTWVLEIYPSINSVSMSIWWMAETGVGVVDIDVQITDWNNDVHGTVSGELSTLSSSNSSYSFYPSDYCDFDNGDTITVSVWLYSTTSFSASMGGCDSTWDWKSIEFSYGTSGTKVVTMTLTGNNSADMTLYYWYASSGAIAVNKIQVTKTEAESSEEDEEDEEEFIWKSTSTSVQQTFNIADYLTDYTAGDAISIQVTFKTDAVYWISYNLGANEYKSGSGVWTEVAVNTGDVESPYVLTLDLGVSYDNTFTVGYWYNSGGSYLGITDITITRTESSGDDADEDAEDEEEEDEEEESVIYTYSSTSDSPYTFTFSDYCTDYVAGETEVTITVTLEGDSYFQAALGTNMADDSTTWTSTNDTSSDGSSLTLSMTLTPAYTQGQVQLWYMGDYCTYVDITSITVTVTSDEEDEESAGVTTYLLSEEKGSNTDFGTTDVSWLATAADTDEFTFVYTCTDSSHAYWGVISLGVNAGESWSNYSWYQIADSFSAGSTYSDEVTVTMTIAELLSALGIEDATQILQFYFSVYNGGNLLSVSYTTYS